MKLDDLYWLLSDQKNQMKQRVGGVQVGWRAQSPILFIYLVKELPLQITVDLPREKVILRIEDFAFPGTLE